MQRTAVLAYHSHNIRGNGYGENDHVALARDLEVILEVGARVLPLAQIASVMRGEQAAPPPGVQVGLSFDDGPIFDFVDFDHPHWGPQRSFLNILEDFRARHGREAQPQLHATSFVIASPAARRAMERDRDSGFADMDGWLSDEWWPDAVRSGLIAVGNHSWDHVHHTVPEIAVAATRRNDFTVVDDLQGAEAEIRTATEFINARIHGACSLFAYPFGHVNQFLSSDYLPKHQDRHGMRAAFGTGGRVVEAGDSVWNIPRLVCGYHWKSPAELAALLRS